MSVFHGLSGMLEDESQNQFLFTLTRGSQTGPGLVSVKGEGGWG